MDTRLELKLLPSTRLVMSLALRQAIEILEMPQLELALWMRQEIEKNPLLEEVSKKSSPVQASFQEEIVSSPTLGEHILKQIQESILSDEEKKTAEKLYQHLDEKGFFQASLEEVGNELGLDLAEIEAVFSVLQTFDPPGIFARNLQEGLLLQLKALGLEKSLSYQLVKTCFEDLLHGRFKAIEKKMGRDGLSEAVERLSKLFFRPATQFRQEIAQAITPDLKMIEVDGKWLIEVLEDMLPQVHVHREYEKIPVSSPEEKEALREWKTALRWLFRSLKRRRALLLEIGILLVRRQLPFLEGKAPMQVLSMKEGAEILQIHESTLSRAVSGKHVETSRGIFPLKDFFPLSSTRFGVKEELSDLVSKEDKEHPLSDEELAKSLLEKGHKVARRTIAKYRKELNISPSATRKALCR